jgi:hypothetical protein
MTLILEVPPDREAVLQAQAQACGLGIQELGVAFGRSIRRGFCRQSQHLHRPRPIGEIVLDNMKDLPCEEFAHLPNDEASQHDHYLYGHPRHLQ